MKNTPKMTVHARVRCAELGISTKRAKRIVQHRSGTYPSSNGHSNNGVVVFSASDSEIAVVWDEERNEILTVLPRVQETYVRTSNGFEVRSA